MLLGAECRPVVDMTNSLFRNVRAFHGLGGLTSQEVSKDNPRNAPSPIAQSEVPDLVAASPPDRTQRQLQWRHAMTRATELDGELIDSKKKMVSGKYLRNAWYVAAWSDDLTDGQLLGRTILKEPIVLYRKSDGNVAALQDRCPHRFAPLHMGQIVNGDCVQCPYHGLEFDSSGACVLNPHGTKNIPPRARVRSYPVTEKHKAIWVWMGEKAPDLTKVPDFSVLDNVPEMHATKRDRITIRANYELIIDNLLDLSHGSFLHAGILGNSETVEAEITVDLDGNDVVVGRHASNATAPGLFAILMPSKPDRIDKFTRMRWMAPSNLRLVTGICMPGAVPESGTGYHAIHMLTPESDKTTHYFFTAVRFNVLTSDDQLNAQIQDKISTTRRFAFEEQDAPVIEAQQAIIDNAPTSLDPVILAIDVGPVRYKQVLQKLIHAEQTQ
jgi:phenylpropionate dioxygenase-like ring-hydroxylating dioxygenase large terminal subunit